MEQAQALTILLIEADHSLRRLIALGLGHRGLQVVAASELAATRALNTRQIDLVVLDIDSGTRSSLPPLELIERYCDVSTVPVVLLAWDSQPVLDGTSSPVATALLTRATCLAKPFDARILHRTIDQLLAAKAQAEAEQENLLLASYKCQTQPSIWPIITAAGLLLVVAGMLLQFLVAVLGFLIVIVALLVWSLGSRQEVARVALS